VTTVAPVKIPGYTTVAELAAELKISQGVIRWHIREGNLTAYSTPRDWIIPDAAANEFRAGRTGTWSVVEL
jgi:hypothetical protein